MSSLESMVRAFKQCDEEDRAKGSQGRCEALKLRVEVSGLKTDIAVLRRRIERLEGKKQAA